MPDILSISIVTVTMLFIITIACVLTFMSENEQSPIERIDKFHSKHSTITIDFNHQAKWYIVKIYDRKILQSRKVFDTRLDAKRYVLKHLDEKGDHAR